MDDCSTRTLHTPLQGTQWPGQSGGGGGGGGVVVLIIYIYNFSEISLKLSGFWQGRQVMFYS